MAAATMARTAADTLIWLSNGRRLIIVRTMAGGESDVEALLDPIVKRVRAEEAIIDPILGLPANSMQILGAEDQIRGMLRAWYEASPGKA